MSYKLKIKLLNNCPKYDFKSSFFFFEQKITLNGKFYLGYFNDHSFYLCFIIKILKR